jgi:hypothetical protein
MKGGASSAKSHANSEEIAPRRPQQNAALRHCRHATVKRRCFETDVRDAPKPTSKFDTKKAPEGAFLPSAQIYSAAGTAAAATAGTMFA